MSILILNGSPRGADGNTHQFLEPFVEGLREAGAAVEVVEVRGLDVRPCTGCFHCWRGDGQCAVEDDMRWLVPRVGSAETLVLAAPLYVDHLPGPLKTLLDRLIPLAEPQIELVDGHCRHPRRSVLAALKRVVLLSVCGFWELDNFDVLVAWTEAMCRNLRCECAGKLLRPHAYAFGRMPGLTPAKRRVVRGVRQAAAELVAEGRISPEAEAAAAGELVSREFYIRASNRSWG